MSRNRRPDRKKPGRPREDCAMIHMGEYQRRRISAVVP